MCQAWRVVREHLLSGCGGRSMTWKWKCSTDLGESGRDPLWHQPVAVRLGHQELGVGWIGFDLLAQAVDVGLEGVRGHVRVVAPDLTENLGVIALRQVRGRGRRRGRGHHGHRRHRGQILTNRDSSKDSGGGASRPLSFARSFRFLSRLFCRPGVPPQNLIHRPSLVFDAPGTLGGGERLLLDSNR